MANDCRRQGTKFARGRRDAEPLPVMTASEDPECSQTVFGTPRPPLSEAELSELSAYGHLHWTRVGDFIERAIKELGVAKLILSTLEAELEGAITQICDSGCLAWAQEPLKRSQANGWVHTIEYRDGDEGDGKEHRVCAADTLRESRYQRTK